MFYLCIEKINVTVRQVSEKAQAQKSSEKKSPEKKSLENLAKRIHDEIENFGNSDSENEITDEEIAKTCFLFIFLNIELKNFSFRK